MSGTRERFEKAAKTAAEQTNEELAGEISRLKSVSWEGIREMLPEPMDQEQLDELIRIVQSDTDHNKKVAALINSIGKLGSVVVKVLGKLS